MFNTAGVTDEENAPTAAISKEAGREIKKFETECEPPEISKNSGKEPGFSFPDMDLFAFNLMYLGQYLSVESPKILLSLA